MPRPGPRSERGYDSDHESARRALLPFAYGSPCPLCGQVMELGQPLDLDHTDDRSGYVGMAHARCNRRKGGRKAAARRAERRNRRLPKRRNSRPW